VQQRFVVSGNGGEIGSTSDTLLFMFREFTNTGSFNMVVQIESTSNVVDWAKFGIMGRSQLVGGATMVSTLAYPKENLSGFVFRNVTNAKTVARYFSSYRAFLRLEQLRDTFTSSVSTDGPSWVRICLTAGMHA